MYLHDYARGLSPYSHTRGTYEGRAHRRIFATRGRLARWALARDRSAAV